MIARRPLLAALSLMPSLLAGAARAEGELDRVQKKVFTAKSFHLESGVVMAEIVIAYETYGTLAPDGRNAVLLTHGYTSSQHMAGRYAGGNGAANGEGSWDGLVGPGKAIDTDRLFVVSSNMLGSSYGSTSPAFPVRSPTSGTTTGPAWLTASRRWWCAVPRPSALRVQWAWRLPRTARHTAPTRGRHSTPRWPVQSRRCARPAPRR